MATINFVELPARNLKAAKSFYESVFGWTLTDFGPDYASTMTGRPNRSSGGPAPGRGCRKS